MKNQMRFSITSWMVWVLAWSLMTIGLLGTYVNIRFHLWPVWHLDGPYQNDYIQAWSTFFQPFSYPILYLLGMFLAWQVRVFLNKDSARNLEPELHSEPHSTSTSATNSTNESSPQVAFYVKPLFLLHTFFKYQGLNCLGVIVGLLFGLLTMLAISWSSASYQAYEASMKYSMEVKAFAWLYQIPQKASDQSPTPLRLVPPAVLAQRILEQEGGVSYSFDSHQCLQARDALQRWVKDTSDVFGFVLQQDMVFLNYKHGCLHASDVLEYHNLLKLKALHSKNEAELLFPWLFDAAHNNMVDSLQITPQTWNKNKQK